MTAHTIKIRMSQLRILREYLDAASVDFHKLQADIDEAELLVSQKKETLSKADKDYAPIKAERELLLRQKEVDARAAYDDYKRSGEDPHRSAWLDVYEGTPHFDLALNLHRQVEASRNQHDTVGWLLKKQRRFHATSFWSSFAGWGTFPGTT